MAINIEWQVKPPSKNEDKPLMFPRITDSKIVYEQQLAELMASHGSLSRGNAKTALNDLAEVMADLLREGKTINIPSLGSFKLSIGTNSEIRPDSDRRMRSIVVRGVNFQPDKGFMDAIGKPTFQWKPTTGVAIAPTVDQLIPQLLTYFKTNGSVIREEFYRAFGLKRTMAYMRLKVPSPHTCENTHEQRTTHKPDEPKLNTGGEVTEPMLSVTVLKHFWYPNFLKFTLECIYALYPPNTLNLQELYGTGYLFESEKNSKLYE